MSGKIVTEGHERTCKGPYIGGRKATSASWQYADLSSYANEYVEINAEDEALFVCFVSGTSVTPATTAGASFAVANTARFVAAGESIQRVVDEDRPYLAFLRGEASDGVITIFGTGR
jgi:hypothetical protein